MKSSKSSLFLIELIISILFFSLASAACIQLFVKAHLLDKKTQETNQIVMWSQNLAELWYASDGEIYPVYERLVADYDEQHSYLSNDRRTITLYFNKDWELCDLKDVSSFVYHIEFSESPVQDADYVKAAEITFSKISGSDTTLLYSQSLTRHTTLERRDVYE